MKKIPLWIGLGLLLGACSTSHLKPVCPTLVDYSPADQNALSAELLQPGERPQTIRWIGDYIGLRDQVRTCQK